MENIDIAQKNTQHTLLTVLMESMLKLPEITADALENQVSASEPVKTGDQGERVDILA
jgi:hypothetical protein